MNKDWEQSYVSALLHLNGTYFLLGVGNFHILWMSLILWNELSKIIFTVTCPSGYLAPLKRSQRSVPPDPSLDPSVFPGADKKPWRPYWAEQLGNKCADIHPSWCHEHNWAQPALQAHIFLLRLECEMFPHALMRLTLGSQQFRGSKTSRTRGLANQSESPGGELWKWNPPTGPSSLPPGPPWHTSSCATNSHSHG